MPDHVPSAARHHPLTWRDILARIVDLAVSVWRVEPTVLLELGVSWVVGAWSVTSLLYGFGRYPPRLAESLGIVSSALLGMSGLCIVTVALFAIVARQRDARGYVSFASAVWLGYVAAAILATDHRLAAGWVYGGIALAALLPFWRIVAGRRL